MSKYLDQPAENVIDFAVGRARKKNRKAKVSHRNYVSSFNDVVLAELGGYYYDLSRGDVNANTGSET